MFPKSGDQPSKKEPPFLIWSRDSFFQIILTRSKISSARSASLNESLTLCISSSFVRSALATSQYFDIGNFPDVEKHKSLRSDLGAKMLMQFGEKYFLRKSGSRVALLLVFLTSSSFKGQLESSSAQGPSKIASQDDDVYQCIFWERSKFTDAQTASSVSKKWCLSKYLFGENDWCGICRKQRESRSGKGSLTR